MRYVLDRDVALRSWERIPWACYRWGDPIPRRLERDAFELLALCDGEHDLEPSPLLGKLVSANMAHPAAPGETWDAWSAPCSYGNRLFHSLDWAVTGRCNYRCRHCFMADGSGPMLGQFSWEECVSLLDECERCGIQTVTLTGGEPMLHPDFMDIVRECARRRRRRARGCPRHRRRAGRLCISPAAAYSRDGALSSKRSPEVARTRSRMRSLRP